MKTIACVLAAVACAAQEPPNSAAEVRAELEKQLRGQSDSQEVQPLGTVLSFVPPAPKPPAAGAPGVASVASLRHKVPKKAKQTFEQALKLSAKGEFAAAAGKLEEALAADPDFIEARANLGVQYFRLDRLEEAAAEFERALALDPSSYVVHANLAAVELRRRNFHQAEAHARRALAISGANPRARYLLGLALLGAPETEAEALRHLEQAAPAFPAAKAALEKYRAYLAGQ